MKTPRPAENPSEPAAIIAPRALARRTNRTRFCDGSLERSVESEGMREGGGRIESKVGRISVGKQQAGGAGRNRTPTRC